MAVKLNTGKSKSTHSNAAICAQEEIEGGWKETQAKIWEEACEKFTKEVPIALTLVEKEFRSLLGVLKKGNS
jgi:hypothetical protein